MVIKNNNKAKPHHTQEGGALLTEQQFQNHEFSKTAECGAEGNGLLWAGGPVAVQLLPIKAPPDSLWATFQQKIL